MSISVDIPLSQEIQEQRYSSETVAFQIASYLTDPICNCHKCIRLISVVDSLYPTSSKISNFARKIFLSLEAAAWGFLSLFTTIAGIIVRLCTLWVQTKPFLHEEVPGGKKKLISDFFTLLSWNVCFAPAGYTITDGNIHPGDEERARAILEEIRKAEPDVTCLYEIFDIQTALYFCKKLKEQGYKSFYFHMGAKAVGTSSAILVASKFQIRNPEFTPFPRDMLVGRTKNAGKGVFAFDLESDGQIFARLHTTHLQHSEEPAFPTAEEIEARQRQMEIVAAKATAVKDRCMVVAGDLNLDDAEYLASSWHPLFEKGDHFTEHTWGGDAFCAIGKRISGPRNLDHTMIVKGTARSIHTTTIKTNYDPTRFQKSALSDHLGLLSKITIRGNRKVSSYEPTSL